MLQIKEEGEEGTQVLEGDGLKRGCDRSQRRDESRIQEQRGSEEEEERELKSLKNENNVWRFLNRRRKKII